MPSIHRFAMMLVGLAAVLFAGAPFVALAAGNTGDIVVRAEKEGAAIHVHVELPVDAPRTLVWEVLTDYDRMTEFISTLQQSVVRMRFGDRLQVFQKGVVSRGPLTFPFESLRDIELSPQREVRSRVITGDTMPAEFTTRIEERGGLLQVIHTGRYTPSIWIPPILGTALIEMETRKQYGEIRDEILRRKVAP